MKKGFSLIFIVLAISLMLPLAIATEEGIGDIGNLWDKIKENTSQKYNQVNDKYNQTTTWIETKTLWLVGATDSEGNNTALVNVKDFDMASLGYMLMIGIVLGFFIALIRNEMHQVSLGLQGFITYTGVGGFIGSIVYLIFVNSGYEYFGTANFGESLAIGALTIIFAVIFAIIDHARLPIEKHAKIWGGPIHAIVFTIAFIILMGIPLINRFLQIITLDLLGVHPIWRALIIAAIIYYFPNYIKSYYEYEKRKKKYNKALKKAAGEEIVKIHLRR